jgi:hypothetical protein
MKYTVEMSSDAMICIPRFIKIGSGIHKLIVGYTDAQIRRHTDTQIHRQHGERISLPLFFFQNKESRLKRARAFISSTQITYLNRAHDCE